jgi:hypothetical protein
VIKLGTASSLAVSAASEAVVLVEMARLQVSKAVRKET